METKQKTLAELISKFENGNERYHKSAMFHQVITSLLYGADELSIINDLLIANENQQKAFEDYAKSDVRPVCVPLTKEAAELYAGQTKQLEKYSAIEKAVEIASKNVTAPKVVREGIVTPISEQSEPVSLDLLSILEGIDKTDSEGGWWDTSVGAEFGKNKLKELQILFDKAKQPVSIAFLSDDDIYKITSVNESYHEASYGEGFTFYSEDNVKNIIESIQSELRKRVNAADPDQVLNDVLNGFVSGKYKRPTDSNSIAQFVIDYLKTK